ncbi:pentatricopeptide repeat-containing protein, putative [Ricinus communis]|uniref:Pentatricopeptide repeat-containing protein, putative n=1 Tax=Ricinus communis TaxID=3988 RepID=B9RCW5_RICCO|nr:pentatricopeptide repeat-containing protein, putative [Ricinus communis]
MPATRSSSGRCLHLLEKCKSMKQLKQAHAQAITCGLGNNSFTLSRILAFCSDPNHASLSHAWKIFQHIQQPTICIYNTMIKALLLKGFSVNAVVGNSLILMYCGFCNMRAARYVFDEIPGPCVVSWTLMISGFAKVGDIESARLFFDGAPRKDRGICGAMISGYVQNNCFKECLYMFSMIQLTDNVPDEGIFLSILCACAQLGALDTGIWIHRYMDRLGLPLTIRLSTGLIDMYAKCGNVDLAKSLFDEMPQRDTVCWNVMISGLAMHGDGEGAINLFLKMEEAGFKPDDVTFIAILSACSYSGMAYEGFSFRAFWNELGPPPLAEESNISYPSRG